MPHCTEVWTWLSSIHIRSLRKRRKLMFSVDPSLRALSPREVAAFWSKGSVSILVAVSPGRWREVIPTRVAANCVRERVSGINGGVPVGVFKAR